MEIGGYDTIFNVEPHEMAKKIIDFLDWKDSTIELDEGDDFFYYKDQAALDGWNNDAGAENVMIYFIFDEGRLTICTDEQLTDEIRANFPEYLTLQSEWQ